MGETTSIFKSASDQPDSTDLKISWYGETIGTASVTPDGITWKGYQSDDMKALFGDILPTRESDGMPQFLVNIEPDNDVFDNLGIKNQAEYLLTGLRFSSNTLISRNAPFDRPVLDDYLQADFSDFIDGQGVFTGSYYGRPPQSLEEHALGQELSKIWENPYVPRFSGKELKLPVTLHEKGEIQRAITTPFTHFLKFPNEGYKEGWGVNEWMCMTLAEATGLPTAKHALISIDDKMPPAYIVERFDINDETRKGKVRRLIQDFCTLAGMRPLKGLKETKDEGLSAGSIEKVAKTLKSFSTDPETDIENLFKRCLVSIAVGDSDMHRKNISMLFRYDAQGKEILSANMSPAYDITSEIYLKDDEHEMVLPMNGKKHRLNRKTLLATAQSMGIKRERAEEIIDHTFTTVAHKAVEIAQNLPDIAKNNPMCLHTAQRIATIAVNKANAMGCDTPEWEPVERIKVKDQGVGLRDTSPIEPLPSVK